MTIREATISDAEAITRIYNAYVQTTTISFETSDVEIIEMEKRISDVLNSGMPYLVCESEGELVAYCYAHPWKSKAAYQASLETTIYVSPNYKGRGLGFQLMLRLIETCRSRGVHVLIACITADNEASCRFHEKLGFRKVSEFKEVGYKFGRFLDVVDYQLCL